MLEGLIGKKIEMTQFFQDDGTVVPVTVIEAGPCVITQVKNEDKEGYKALQMGFGHTKPKNLKKSAYGHLKNIKEKPRYLKEFRVKEIEEGIKVGKTYKAEDVFAVGDMVRVTGTSKGKGFAGVIKRWGFHGGPKTHGQSDRLRAPGSIGGGTDPGRVYKGKKMAGRMGGDTVTVIGLEVIEIDNTKNHIKVKGAVPGHEGAIVTVQKGRK